jgi:hypothetical protein
VGADIWYFGVEFLICACDFSGDVFGLEDAGVFVEEDGDHEVFDVCEVDEVFFVVEVDHLQVGVGFGLYGQQRTLCRLLSVWLMALIRRVAVWMNF